MQMLIQAVLAKKKNVQVHKNASTTCFIAINMEQLAFHRLFFCTVSVKLHDLSTSLMSFIEISEH